MGLWDFIKTELIDIVEWLDDSGDTLVYRFQRHDNEIKNGAQLTVRPGQAAVFVNEGKIADVFEPGRYELSTKNLPILATLRGWKYGFDSPFKVEVYFVSTRQFTDQKWGTKNPLMLRDPEFGPIRLRAFGTYAFRASEPAKLIAEIVGTDGHFTVDEIHEQLRNLVVSRFADALGEGKIPALDLAGNYDELGDKVRGKIAPEFNRYGLELTTLLVENVSLPPEVEQALDKRSSMGVLGDLQAYTRYQTAEAIGDAAKQPGGMAGADGPGPGRGPAAPGRRRAAPAPGAGDVLRGAERPAERPARDGRAAPAGRRRHAHPRDAGVEAGDGGVDAGRAGLRALLPLRRRAATAPTAAAVTSAWCGSTKYKVQSAG
jgi:membrane protease subunit (stomatin/prohibitin family)